MNKDSKDSDILEGEVVGAAPEPKKRTHRSQTKAEFNLFKIPLFAKLRRNCLLSLASFVVLTGLAIYFGNGWLFLLAVLLPPWIFSQKRF